MMLRISLFSLRIRYGSTGEVSSATRLFRKVLVLI